MSDKNLAAIVLAAGTSSRSGKVNKLLYKWEGKELILHAIEPLLQAKQLDLIDTILIVSGHENEKLSKLLADYDLDIVINEDYNDGMGTSIATGINKIKDNYDGVFISLGDMPKITVDHYQLLFDNFAETKDIVVPAFNNDYGHPKLFGADYFNELAKLAGDSGARYILDNNKEQIIEVEANARIVYDVDLIK